MIAPVTKPTSLRVVIPGDPCAQGRGRAVRCGNSVRVIDPAKSRSWKGAAQVHMLAARQAAGLYAPFDVALEVVIVALWQRPKSYPKRAPATAQWRPSRPDADNVAKAVFDAGNGVLWADDALIVDVRVKKGVAELNGAPRVEVSIDAIGAPRAEGAS